MAKIMVIEDEAAIREEVMEWLQFEGHNVSGASSGRPAIAAIQRDPPDIVLCDIWMPEMDGYAVLIELRSNPALAHIPFVFLSASASHEAVRYGMDLGADDYLTKPFTHAELIRAIESRLHKQSSQNDHVSERMEALSEALEDERTKRLLKTRLVAMFSHDFRTPLSTIMSSVELIRHYEARMTPERKAMHLDRIEGSVHLLMQMLDDMLLIAQMESGSFQYHPEALDLSDLTSEVLDEFRAVYGGARTLTLRAEGSCCTQADRRLFRQILANLVANAIKYSPDDSEVIVGLDNRGDYVEMVVEDQGIGIPADDLEAIFEPFHRAGNAEEFKGTGLGLTIVKEAVERHGGTIRVESEIEKGSRFIVTIPAAPAG